MQIGPISPVLPTPTASTTVVEPQTAHQPAPAQPRAVVKAPPIDPGFAIHPTLQDRIDVTRMLLLLREV